MHLRSSSSPVRFLVLGLILTLAVPQSWSQAAQEPVYKRAQKGRKYPPPPPLPGQEPPVQAQTAPQPDAPQQEAAPVPPAPNQPGSTVQVPAQQGQATRRGRNDEYIFTSEVEEVSLQATVVDARNRLVTDLSKEAFTVYENGVPQAITGFERRDVPVSLGILIDNSGSMREKRPHVNAAALNLVRSSNPRDEVFVVNFADEPYLDQDFTNNVQLLKEALENLSARGGTGLYDAVIAAADHLAKSGKYTRKVLLVVTDGEDNASRQTLEQAVRRVQAENGPTIYAIGIMEGKRERRARRALEALSYQTGGMPFFPREPHEVEEIAQAVSRDIRNQYIIVYKPSESKAKGGYRTIKVEAKAKGYKDLQVRTRSGYFPGQERAAR